MPNNITKDQYARKYLEALRLLDREKFEECINATNHNALDLSLPPYWQIKNIIVVISALRDWNEAKRYQIVAEEVCRAAKSRATGTDAEEEVLAHLRSGLDMSSETWQSS